MNNEHIMLEFTLSTIVSTIGKLFVLILIGYILYWRKLIDDKFIDTVGLLLIRIMVPALILSKTIAHFSFAEYSHWWLLPIFSGLVSLVGVLFGLVCYKFLNVNFLKKEFVASSAFQNAGYIPMNLILFSFTGPVADKLFIYLFLFLLGFNIVVWSFTPLYLSGKVKHISKQEALLNPPAIATFFSLIWVFFMGKNSMPPVLMEPIKQLGLSAFPLAMLVLGAYLCKYKAYDFQNVKLLAGSVVVKLVLVPAFIFFILRLISLEPSLKFFLFLESIMPTAVSLVVIGSYTGSDNKFFSSSIFYTHLVSIFTIPAWLAIFKLWSY